ncbi:hypothetical protein J6590_012497 [Homalodisca vitripennis]|nr:hypothetical protein J6590_012497 [Homalodisca vitripennis]
MSKRVSAKSWSWTTREGFASLKFYNRLRTEAECLGKSERKELESDHFQTEAECLGKSERKELEWTTREGFASLKFYNRLRTEAECLGKSERKELELDHTRGFC